MSCVNLPAGMLERCERTLRRAPEFSRRAPTYLSPLPDLELVSYPIRTEFEATLYEPIVCVALRGCKETAFAERTLRSGPEIACSSVTICPWYRASPRPPTSRSCSA